MSTIQPLPNPPAVPTRGIVVDFPQLPPKPSGLRARVEAAPVGEVFSYRCVEDGGYLRAVVDAPTDLIGQRVRLVADETGEG